MFEEEKVMAKGEFSSNFDDSQNPNQSESPERKTVGSHQRHTSSPISHDIKQNEENDREETKEGDKMVDFDEIEDVDMILK